MFRIRIIDSDDGISQHTLALQAAQADDAGGGLFRAADDISDEITPPGVNF